ncbi:S-4TM family putative pore-forming effector [Actinomadura fibrosa]|uniref:S-4TM family putative pore-forming effector n=1 Tax=Actinomadura fibrosa TaxID=111802 RepID=A0ABW2XHQ1_9ACTN|nr:S-4TM family putative pore-forming effector [Actinomadura fibrosa]
MATTTPIAERQASATAVRLLKAVRVTHLYNQRVHALSLAVSTVLAITGLLGGSGSRYRAAATLVGAMWAALYKAALVPLAERYLRTAATLQEMYDAEVLGLPWNGVTVGKRIGDDEVSRLSRRFRGNEERLPSYYIVANVAEPYDVFFCLEQNLAWGSRIRLRFAQVMLGVLVLWSVAGIVFTLATGATVSRLLTRWFLPSLGLLLVCLEMYRTQMGSIRERMRVLDLVRAAMEEPSSEVISRPAARTLFARQVQDTLFHVRQLQPRLPSWFFDEYHDQDEADFEVRRQLLESEHPRS